MPVKKSLMTKLGLPAAFGLLLLTLALVLLLAPYFSDADFGIFKVPALTAPMRHFLQYFAPVLLILLVLSFYPFWTEQVVSFRSAGTSVPTTVVFKNASSGYINIDWIDLEGKKNQVNHYMLAPGESQEVDTYVAHIWSVTNANTGVELKSVIATAQPSTVTIR